MVAMTVMCVMLYVLAVSMMRACECEGNAGVGMGEVWLWLVRGMSYVGEHVVYVLCLAHMTC